MARISADARSRSPRTAEPGPARRSRWSFRHRRAGSLSRLLRRNPVLLLPDRPSPREVAALVTAWNPAPALDTDGVPLVAAGVRWHGPVPLAPITNAGADLPVAWSVGYIAEVPDRSAARGAAGFRPALAPEVAACRLVRGLARLLHGTARLPRAIDDQSSHDGYELVVYGHDPLPWRVLREILRIVEPTIERSAMLATDDYTLADTGTLAVRAAPSESYELLPYALRAGPDASWPHTAYRFVCRAETDDPAAALRARRRLSRCAVLLSDVVGGTVLDTDGFPLSTVDLAAAAAGADPAG